MAEPIKKSAPKKLRIPGTVIATPPLTTSTITIKQSRSFAIGSQRDAAAQASEIDTAADEVVEIELEDGSRFWTTRQRLCEEVLRGTEQRGGDGTMTLPASLPLITPSRGPVGSLAIKVLRFFNIDVPKLAASKIAKLVEKKGLQKSDGKDQLFHCASDREFKLGKADRIPTDRPILLFIHGTGSSSQGSFGELWHEDRNAIRETLFQPYNGNVFAFEHRTLSASPIDNAIELVGNLPKGARLHVISHSRGGLVGELLCRANVTGGRDPFDRSDLDFLKKNDPDGSRGDLAKLNKLLKAQSLHVERFVRVACPARGTSLASERLDLYLSVLFNLIEKIPVLNSVLDVLSELIMAIAKERADPDVLPGIEAMIPNSPLVRLLNRPGITVDGELRVIAGDIEGNNLGAALSTLVTDPLYLSDHDLVVDTAAMFGGAERQAKAAKFSFYRGAQVSHFRYFVNEDSSSRIAKAIARKETEDDGFEEFNVRQTDTTVPPYKRDAEQPKPVVFLLPGIMGSHLAIGKDRIWIDPLDLAFGGLSRLHMGAQGVIAEAPVGLAYGDFIKFLSHSHEVVPFPYDWRISLLEEAGRLADAIENKLEETEKRNHPLCIVAHSMGGLLARAMIALRPEIWQRICKHPDARLIMLGTPNGGSFIVPLVFTGRESMVKQLAMADFTSSQAELLEVLRRFPGLAQMMPAVESTLDFFSADTWNTLRGADEKNRKWQPPDPELLAQAKAFRNFIDNLKDKPTIFPERMRYVAGQAPATPLDLKIDKDDRGNPRIVVEATAEGDGRVLWSTGRLPGVKTWYMPALHGDLADHAEAFPALKELIDSGTTDKLPTTPPATRGVPARFELREEVSPLYPDGTTLLRAALGKAPRARGKTPHRTKVSVVHGNLAFARHPVMVGHYQGDSIVSAEAHLDLSLNGRLRERFRLGLYPGPIETEAVILDPAAEHVGAVVIGLGEVGTLSPGELARAVSHGARAFAITRSEANAHSGTNGRARRGLSLSALMIGTGAGGLSIDDAVTAILRGIANANQMLIGPDNGDSPRIDEIEFIELYEDRAIQAVHALRRVNYDAELSRRLDIATDLVIENRRGSRRRVSFAEDPNWWQRLQIVEDSQERLAFHMLTDRARTQAYLQPTQRSLVDGFIHNAISTAATDPAIAVTLFEMLIPNELKDRAPEQRDLVLILNDAAARYPWELMQERPRHNNGGSAEPQKPLSIQAGLLRQLQSTTFRERVIPAQGHSALVVGDPPSNFVPLPGAVDEAKTAQQKLRDFNYEVVSIIREKDTGKAELATEILKHLYAKDYRILHLAGHGVYEFAIDRKRTNAANPCAETEKVSGMVIGENQFLTAAEIRQMRAVPELVFINCCHLGHIEDKPETPDLNFSHLAANLATELIRMGVRAVIAAGWAVDDQAAQTFAEVFYDSFLKGEAFGDSVHRARKEIFAAFPQVNTWGAYQCYGDPSFTLGRPGSSSGTSRQERSFAAPSEAVVALQNIAEDATTQASSYNAERIERLQKLLTALPHDWLERGDIRAALGKAFGELGLFGAAIEHYDKALAAETAQIPIECVEQLCNLMVREAIKRDNRKEAKKHIAEAKQRLGALIAALGETAERCNLLGSIAKREAVWAKTRGEKATGLTTMRDAYKHAHEIKTKANKAVDPYPLINWLTADILLAQLGKKGEPAQTIQSQLQSAVEAAIARDQQNRNFWDAVSVVDAKLLQYLSAGTLAAHAKELIAQYLAVKQRGSPREFRSVVEQFEFLSATIAVGTDNAKRKQLRAALETIKHGITQSGGSS